MCRLLKAGGCNLHHPHSVITAVYDCIKQHTHAACLALSHSICPSLRFTHTNTHIHSCCLSHWLCDYCRLVRGSYQCCDGSGWWNTHPHTHTHLRPLQLSPSLFFSLLVFLSLSAIPCPSSGSGRAAVLRLRSPRRAVCQFRRLALKPDMSSSAQLGRQPITMLSRALPQGWKELNTCWLSVLSLCLCLWDPLFLTHWLSLHFFFSSLLVIYSFTQSCILLLRLLFFSWSVVFNRSFSPSIPNLDTHTHTVYLSVHSSVRLSVCLSVSHPPFSFSLLHVSGTHKTFQWALWCHCSGACGSKRCREGRFLKWQG